MNVAGHRELVRSVLTSLLVYLLTIIKAPKQFIKELDKIRRKFLWAGDKEMSRGKCKVAWEKTCMPIMNGVQALLTWSNSAEPYGFDGFGSSGTRGTDLGMVLSYRLTSRILPCSTQLPW